MEPETVADGVRGCFGGVEEVPAGWEVFDAEEAGGGGECDEVDAYEEGWGEREEEQGGSAGGGGHWVRDEKRAREEGMSPKMCESN